MKINFCSIYKLAIATAVAAAVVVIPTVAQAAFQMKLTSTLAGSMTVVDGGGGDISGSSGSILFVGSFGGFDFQINSGLSKPLIGTAANPMMQLTYTLHRDVAGPTDTLSIEVSDTGFGPAPKALSTTFGGTNSASTTSTTVFGAGVDNALYNYSLSNTLGTFSSLSFSQDGSFNVPSAAAYSLSIKSTIVSTGATSNMGGTAKLFAAAVPEPTTFAMFGFGALGLVVAARRRRQVAAV